MGNIIDFIIPLIVSVVYFILYFFYRIKMKTIRNKRTTKVATILFDKEILKIIILLSLSYWIASITIFFKINYLIPLSLAMIFLIWANFLFLKNVLIQKDLWSIIFAAGITIFLLILFGTETALLITETKDKFLWLLVLGLFIITSIISFVMMNRYIEKNVIKIPLLGFMYILVVVVGGWAFGSYYYIFSWSEKLQNDFAMKNSVQILTTLAINGAKTFFNYPEKDPVEMIQFLFGKFLDGFALVSIFNSLTDERHKTN